MVARVLVVEDNPLNLKLIKDVLEYQGFEVLTAASGEEGVVAALSDSPDLVLMDLQLPGIDGHEALLRIRAEPRWGGYRWSPYRLRDESGRRTGRGGGFDGYIAKPIDTRGLPGQCRLPVRQVRWLSRPLGRSWADP
jgi:two-component system cell cycle response regulator DivK